MTAHHRPAPDGLHLPAILSYGFRPFFLFGALYAALIVLAWLPILHGTLETASLFAPIDWHVHELMFGYVAAIIAGFLLTAIPNWTRRLPVQGLPLLGLLVLWVAGRIAVFFSAEIGWVAAAVIDCLFLAALLAAAAREIVAGRNWRNLKVLVPVTALLLANALFHVEAQIYAESAYGRRLAIAAVILLILIIGGRVIPSFTHNWLARVNPGRLPVPLNRFDGLVLVLSAAALLSWVLAPDRQASGYLLVLAALFNAARLARWAGDRTLRDPLVLILHLAYLFIPLGLALLGLSAIAPDLLPAVAGLHALGVGAIGTMTLAIMTRATLGHTGRPLKADLPTCLIYAAVMLAALLRIAAAFMPAETALLHLSATLWSAAFLGYCARYGGMLLLPRPKARAPSRTAEMAR